MRRDCKLSINKTSVRTAFNGIEGNTTEGGAEGWRGGTCPWFRVDVDVCCGGAEIERRCEGSTPEREDE